MFAGVFKDIPAYELGATVIRQILEHSQIDPNEINEVILGNVLQVRSRDKILLSYCCDSWWCARSGTLFTVNKVCGSD